MEDELNIPVIERPTLQFDSEKYDGFKTKIASVRKDLVKNFYPNGIYNPESVEMREVIVIETEPLFELDEKGNPTTKVVEYTDKSGNKKNITVSQIFGLQKDADGKTIVSKHPKCSLWKFLRAKGANTVSELKGKTVILKTEMAKNPDDDRKFLKIVI